MKVPFHVELKAAGFPAPVQEFVFTSARRWRFDYAWPKWRIAVEVEGGLYGRGKACKTCGRRAVGAHTSIQRLLEDMEKYNEAALLGWHVLRVTPEEFESGRVTRLLERARANGLI